MNINVFQTNMTDTRHLHGGEYALVDCNIYIDSSLSWREKVGLLFHAFIEVNFPCLDHKKVDELEEEFIEAYDTLEE